MGWWHRNKQAVKAAAIGAALGGGNVPLGPIVSDLMTRERKPLVENMGFLMGAVRQHIEREEKAAGLADIDELIRSWEILQGSFVRREGS